ncbi:hypothetical protein NDN08_002136 [Rhodosorus marinus]|uniref:EGF-like domain-containing protein n=1 Tax=Rhodosorus marinus TaxID=101924 RepID=A0AAV8USU6_9RHOD|nr:hypothetical protein NDN08_002136 [Rhodosorus marinus]
MAKYTQVCVVGLVLAVLASSASAIRLGGSIDPPFNPGSGPGGSDPKPPVPMCSSDLCRNGSTCRDYSTGYKCSCKRGWSLKQCTRPYGKLRVSVREFIGVVPDKDDSAWGSVFNDSDFSDYFVEVEAKTYYGETVKSKTGVFENMLEGKDLKTTLDFGYDFYTEIRISLKDSDRYTRDELIGETVIELNDLARGPTELQTIRRYSVCTKDFPCSTARQNIEYTYTAL